MKATAQARAGLFRNCLPALAIALWVPCASFADAGNLRDVAGGNSLVVSALSVAHEAPLREIGIQEDIISKYHRALDQVPITIVRRELQPIVASDEHTSPVLFWGNQFLDAIDLTSALNNVAVAVDGNEIYVSYKMREDLGELLHNLNFKRFLLRAKIDPTVISVNDLMTALLTREYFATLGLKQDGSGGPETKIFIEVLRTLAAQKSGAAGSAGSGNAGRAG